MLKKHECDILRGWAIIAIALHNFCHWLPNSSAENEFTWKVERTLYFLYHFGDNYFVNFFSFFGHYGVIIFIFLTGYGLAVKYDNKTKRLETLTFIYTHYKKLILLLVPGLLSYYFISWIFLSSFSFNVLQIPSQLLLIINLIPSKIFQIRPGPYWYFGLTMQFYIVFILFIYKQKLYKLLAMTLTCIFCLYYCAEHYQTMEWCKYNYIGSAIPFAIGILTGRNRINIKELSKKNCYILLSIAIPLLLLSELNYYSWFTSSFFVIIIAISFLKCTQKLFICKAMQSIGNISHIIFVVHPLVREIVYYYPETVYKHPFLWISIYLLISLFLSYFIKQISSKKYMIKKC